MTGSARLQTRTAAKPPILAEPASRKCRSAKICDSFGRAWRHFSATLVRMGTHKSWHRRGYLPHFDEGAVVQAITFRLADSLPREAYLKIASLDAAKRGKSIEAHMDLGRGSCILRQPDNARIVQDVLQHFDGERYRLLAWVVMPNHVHVVMEQMTGHRLGDVVRSWKNYSARRINARERKAGILWAPDYFDRFVRNEEHLQNAIRYVEANPVNAGLAREPGGWPYSSFAMRESLSAAPPPCASGDARSQ